MAGVSAAAVRIGKVEVSDRPLPDIGSHWQNCCIAVARRCPLVARPPTRAIYHAIARPTAILIAEFQDYSKYQQARHAPFYGVINTASEKLAEELISPRRYSTSQRTQVTANDWRGITALAREAAGLRTSARRGLTLITEIRP